MNKIVLFDLDGTLLDTLGDLTEAVNYALRCTNMPPRTPAEVRSFVGNGARKLIERSLGEGATEELIDICIKDFSEFYKSNYAVKTEAYDGMLECVDKLLARGIRCGVVTNKLHDISVDLCAKFFPGRFEEVVGDLPDMPRKPDPARVLKMIQKLGGGSALYVGDSWVDVQTAKNAKIPCVLLSWGFNSRTRLLEEGAEYIVDNADGLFNKIIELQNNKIC